MEQAAVEEIKFEYSGKDKVGEGSFAGVYKAKVTGLNEATTGYVVKRMDIYDNENWQREVDNMMLFKGVPGFAQYVTHRVAEEHVDVLLEGVEGVGLKDVFKYMHSYLDLN